MADIELPVWLTDDFVKRILQQVENTELVEPKKITCQEAVTPGNNFMSDVFKVSISYKSQISIVKTASLFVKVPLPVGPKTDFLRSNRVYEREALMYNEILPKLYSINSVRIAPRSYSEVPVENSLVLEDLNESGYRVLNRLEQMDFEHCYHVLVALAKFHATSVKLHKQETELLENIGHHLLFKPEQSPVQQRYLFQTTKVMLNDFAKILSEIGCDRFSRIVSEQIDSYWDRIVNIIKPEGHLSVLCHGDCWMSNIMFKHENGTCVDVKFVDFQTSLYTSYAFDVLMFWWSSANEKARDCHREELFQVYQKTLNETLEVLQCNKHVTDEQFKREIQRVAPICIYVIAFTASACLADPNEFFDMKVADVKDFSAGMESPIMKNLRSKYFTRSLPKLMEQGERFGIFYR